MYYNNFVNEWIKRSERKEDKDFVDIGDKFISLWIAFNSWQKDKFNKTDSDNELMKKVINLKAMKEIFDEFKKDNTELDKLKEYRIIDRKFSKQSSYDGTFQSLIQSLYLIRCNLFHGKKSVNKNKIDRELVELAYNILSPLFKKYLEDSKDY